MRMGSSVRLPFSRRVHRRLEHPEQAHALLTQALAISPLDPLRAVWYQQRSTAYLHEGGDGNALNAAQESIAAIPHYPAGHLNEAVALANLGRQAEAIAALKEHDSLRPGWTIERLKSAATITASPAATKISEPISTAFHDQGMPDQLRRRLSPPTPQ
jgi:tetratricopeptide (TPR) repeat protein